MDYTLTWGLTDWDRAREWIDAGNRAGAWTTDRIRWALPVTGSGWDFGLGPVVGIGAELGPLRVGARFLWSPPALHTGTGVHGTVSTASATVSLAHR